MDQVDVPLQLSVVEDYEPQEDAAVQVPGAPPPGVPLDPERAALLERADDRKAPVYADVSALRAGNSGQTYVGVADAGVQVGLPGLDAGCAGGEAGGD